MATVLDIITRAYRKLGIAAADEAITADMAQLGLDTLNDLMASWQLYGIPRAHSTISEVAQEFPMAQRFNNGVIRQLAAELSPDFEVGPVESDTFLRALQAEYMQIDEVTLDRGLTRMPSQRDGRYWIYE